MKNAMKSITVLLCLVITLLSLVCLNFAGVSSTLGNDDILDFLPAIVGKKGYSLQVGGLPAGTGGVNVSPTQARYALGTKVTLTPSPASGYAFRNWTGDLTGTANPAIITMDRNKKIQAVFAKAPILQAASVNGSQITLTWTFAGWPQYTATNEGYRIEQSTSSASGPFTEIAQIPGRFSPQSHTLTRNPGTYYYRVRVFINQQMVTYSPYGNVVPATVTAQAGPTTLRIINDLCAANDGTYNWSLLNTVITLRVGPTEDSARYGTGAHELLQSSEVAYRPEDARQIAPGQQQDFNVSSYGFISEYYVLIYLGWWDYYCWPPDYSICDWEKHYSLVINCYGKVGNKWAVVRVYPPFGNPEVIKLSDFLPQKSWYGTSFCN